MSGESTSCGLPLAKPDLEQIINTSYDTLFVSDHDGTILFVNSVACRLLALPVEKLVGVNIRTLLRDGVYQRSTALEAAEKKRVVTGLIKTHTGLSLISTSTPLFDEDGNVKLVVTNSRDKALIDSFLASFARELEAAQRYKVEVEYLRGRRIENREVVTASRSMDEVLERSEAVAKVDTSVMLHGESGTGKELIAKYIHRNSGRAKEPFIDVNCAAIPETLIEAELFGYCKGAFTGAGPHGKPGLLELADKGTLFLDEVGELPLPMQSKLLRVLENFEIRRLGGTLSRKVNFRLIAATNRNLHKMVMEGKFRDDLYYRLNVIPVYIPPLRERPEDVQALALHFLAIFNKRYGYDKMFAANVMEELIRYAWPGNVRELRNVVERMVITNPGAIIDTGLEGPYAAADGGARQAAAATAGNSGARLNLRDAVEGFAQNYIREVLAVCGGNVSEAARRLGIHRTILYRKLRER